MEMDIRAVSSFLAIINKAVVNICVKKWGGGHSYHSEILRILRLSTKNSDKDQTYIFFLNYTTLILQVLAQCHFLHNFIPEPPN